ncbi:MAG: hypothetical protein AAB561_00060 [Patescibacteria group bacterium]
MAENPSLELEIQQLERALQEKRSVMEQGGAAEALPEKEVLHSVVGEKIQEHISSSGQQPVSAPAPTAQPADGDQPSYLDPQLQPQVQQLVDIAFTKTLAEAIQAAVKTNNAALIDAFHDVLVDQLYEELLARQKLKQP